MGKNIVVNGVEIFHNVEGAIEQYHASNFELMGEDIGQAMVEIIVGAQKQTGLLKKKLTVPMTMNTLAVKQFFEGVIEGVLVGTKMQDILKCLGDLNNEGVLIEEAIKDFEVQDYQHTKDGIKKIGEAIEALPQSMNDCRAAVSDIKKVVNLIKTFKSPYSLIFKVGKNMIINGVEIFHSIEGAIQSYHKSQYRTMGFDIGEALTEIFKST